MNGPSTVSNEDLRKAFEGPVKTSSLVSPAKSNKGNIGSSKKQSAWDKKMLGMLIAGIICTIGGLVMILITLILPDKEVQRETFNKAQKQEETKVYNALTGEELTNASELNAPTYCVQTPNGLDGARPQAGLTEAGVIFEAIAEAGITRFAAIYQNPTTAIIGPIRSLRTYYLEWDTPFDCTIVHAGGSGDALAAVSSGRYNDLTEDYQYMYRGTYGGRAWNNLFTTSTLLRKFSSDHNYMNSEVKGFARMTPEESARARMDGAAVNDFSITKPAEGDTSEVAVEVANIGLRFGGDESFNVDYAYDAETNTYLRSYESGGAHEVYKCADEDLGEKNPEDVCTLTQMAPAVVVAMVVSERRASDNYHEDIDVIGSGEAYVFQNGGVIEGTWRKATREDQIKFTDANGNEIKLAPGQTFVSAIPSYGSVDF